MFKLVVAWGPRISISDLRLTKVLDFQPFSLSIYEGFCFFFQVGHWLETLESPGSSIQKYIWTPVEINTSTQKTVIFTV